MLRQSSLYWYSQRTHLWLPSLTSTPSLFHQWFNTFVNLLCFLDILCFFGFTDSLCLAALLSRRATAWGTASRLIVSIVPEQENCLFGRDGLTGVTCPYHKDKKLLLNYLFHLKIFIQQTNKNTQKQQQQNKKQSPQNFAVLNSKQLLVYKLVYKYKQFISNPVFPLRKLRTSSSCNIFLFPVPYICVIFI